MEDPLGVPDPVEGTDHLLGPTSACELQTNLEAALTGIAVFHDHIPYDVRYIE
jgi:hypothetical protein